MRISLLLSFIVFFGSCMKKREPVVQFRSTAEYHPEWQKYYDTTGLKGVFILFSSQDSVWHQVYAGDKGGRHIPASTFKIPNSLIALEAGSVKDENEVLKWDGVKRRVDSWNEDTDMKNAIKNSTVWFYQELARRTGGKKMKMYLDTMRYGNADTSGGIDRFWLSGGMRISPIEQITFLKKLYYEQLPFKTEHQRTVKKILVNESFRNDAILSGKSGWGQENGLEVGWYVGYVEKNGKVYFFANCVTTPDSNNPHFVTARKDIAKKILRDMKILE